MFRLRVLTALLFCTVAAAALCPALQGCGASPHRVASVSVVSLGGALAAVHEEHLRVFNAASDALGARLHASGGTVADYDQEAAPLVATFRARGEALQALDAALFSAAAIIDVAHDIDRGDRPPSWTAAAAQVLGLLDRTLRLLADGSVLPRVTVPKEILTVSSALRALTEGLR